MKSGTYEAYKVSYDLDMKVMIKKNIHVVQWLVPSVGMVKSENYNSKNELESYMEMLTFEQ